MHKHLVLLMFLLYHWSVSPAIHSAIISSTYSSCVRRLKQWYVLLLFNSLHIQIPVVVVGGLVPRRPALPLPPTTKVAII